jgi:L-2,4-diaminobutyrate decarboxylase
MMTTNSPHTHTMDESGDRAASDFLIGPAGHDLYKQLITQAAEIVVASLPNQPYAGKNASALAALVDSDILPGAARSAEQVTACLQTVIENSVAVGHPRTIAHLHCPPLLASLAAEVVISALNQSMDSFDQAPIATIIEQKMIRWLCAEVGLPSAADGTFTTGGTQSNYLGLLLARDSFLQKHWNWSAQKSGLPPEARRLRILCSEIAHFTVEKSASQLGLGTDAVVHVDVDNRFRMSSPSLRATLADLRKKDLLPMAIVATAGTTDFGSIDPLLEIADLAQSTGAWLHVDAAYGGALLFSAEHRAKLTGIELADSLGMDFHKLLWQPIPCSAFLLRHVRHFDSMKMHADYLNPELHEEEGIPNLVTTSLLTSRRFDALKLWISLQSLGRKKLAQMIDRTIELAAQTAAFIKKESPHLELIAEPQLSTVVFRYLPKNSPLDADKINTAIRKSFFDSGMAIIGHTRVRGRQCLKFTCMNPAVTASEIQDLVGKIVATGIELEAQMQKALVNGTQISHAERLSTRRR